MLHNSDSLPYGGARGDFVAVIPPQYFNDAEELMELIAPLSRYRSDYPYGFAFCVPFGWGREGDWCWFGDIEENSIHTANSPAKLSRKEGERLSLLYQTLFEQGKVSIILEREYFSGDDDSVDINDEGQSFEEKTMSAAERLPTLVLLEILNRRFSGDSERLMARLATETKPSP